jgi:hypothetical protein
MFQETGLHPIILATGILPVRGALVVGRWTVNCHPPTESFLPNQLVRADPRFSVLYPVLSLHQRVPTHSVRPHDPVQWIMTKTLAPTR